MEKFFNLSNRETYGKFVSAVGIFVNLLLSVVKIAIGYFSGALSILADGFNNLSDIGNSLVMLFGFKVASKPADEEHPFGHGRAEYLAGLFIAAVMIFVGGKLLWESVNNIMEPEEITADNVTLLVLVISVAMKFLLGIFYKHAAQKINSEMVRAAALDSFTDCLATAAVLVSIIVWLKFGINIDGAAGVFVSMFIMRGGLISLNEILALLLGNKPDTKLIEEIKATVKESPEILGVHDLIIHNYGAKRLFVSMHVEIPATFDLLTAHEIVDKVENKLKFKFDISVTLHVDPVVQNDAAFDEHKALAEKILSEISPDLSMHDFRVLPYKTGRKLIFDVKVPENFPLSDRELRKEFQRRLIKLHFNDRAIINLDHQYC